MTGLTRRDALAFIGAGAAWTGMAPAGELSAQTAPPGFGPGPRSNLGWHSGASFGNHEGFEAWRRRPTDTVTIWMPRESWETMKAFDQSGGFNKVRTWPQRVSMGVCPLPNSQSINRYPDSYQRAARGDFDMHYTAISQKLASYGERDISLRIGWEINHDGFPWFAGRDIPNYIATHRRIVDIVRRYNPTATIEWCCLKKGKQPGSVVDLYPGDAYVDVISVDYYDHYPATNTEAQWGDMYMKTWNGGPYGIGAWLKFAQSRGKRLACPEWGISRGSTGGQSKDNPLFIQKMFEFFRANAPSIAYENYFNQKPSHQLYPMGENPLAAAKYLQLWRAS